MLLSAFIEPTIESFTWSPDTPGRQSAISSAPFRPTPQAVQSPMRQLNQRGYIEQRYSSNDRRKRCLFITSKGEALVARLSSRQHGRLAKAFDLAGPAAVRGFLTVMEGMLTEDDRHFVETSAV
ncbi:DNA-binding PadR family transcriptional regulator [Bradyrhizobium sp. F1.13.4]